MVFVMVTVLKVSAQDPQFSQYYQSPLYLNPGFTGITPQQRATFNHRIQWPNLPQAFSTFAASYDIWVDELKSGFGLLATTDKMGSAGWRTTNISLLYSYKLKITEDIVFSPGLSFGYGINGLDRTKLSLGDGLEYGGVSLDPSLNAIGDRVERCSQDDAVEGVELVGAVTQALTLHRSTRGRCFRIPPQQHPMSDLIGERNQFAVMIRKCERRGGDTRHEHAVVCHARGPVAPPRGRESTCNSNHSDERPHVNCTVAMTNSFRDLRHGPKPNRLDQGRRSPTTRPNDARGSSRDRLGPRSRRRALRFAGGSRRAATVSASWFGCGR